MNFKKFYLIVIFMACILMANRVLAASDDQLDMIDKNDTYDIYYSGSSEGSAFIAKRVRIIRIEQINGVDFLVFINDSGFNSKSKEGFILFSTIRAIVPDSTFTIVDGERFKSH